MDNINYRNRLIEIFQSDVFIELLEFWDEIETLEYDYKIFVSKKCFVLYKIFKPLIKQKDEYAIKITDTAIPIYMSKMRGKKILIIDDVFIHGRTSLKISNEISKKAKEVNFIVFAKNNNSQEVQDISAEDLNKRDLYTDIKLEEKYNKIKLFLQERIITSYINCNEYNWKRISDLIIKSFWGMNMPYISYLPIVTLKNKAIWQEFCNDTSAIQYSSHRQNELAQDFLYTILMNDEENISKIYFCLIVSKNNFYTNIKVTPMIFFDCENTSISIKFIVKCIQTIFSEKTNEILTYFKDNKTSKLWLLSLHKFLIFCVAYLKVIQWLNSYGIKKDEYMIDIINAHYSFGKHIDKYLKILEKKSSDNILKNIEKFPIKSKKTPKTIEEKKSIRNNELFEGLKESYIYAKKNNLEKNSFEIVEILSRYFKFNNMYVEKNYYKDIKKDIRGLRFSEIKDFLLDKGYALNDVIFGLMFHYNLGAATIDFLYDYDRGDNIIGINMYWRAGEQSYKCITQTYVPIVYYQSYFYKLFESKVAYFLSKILVEIAKNNYEIYEIPFSENDFKKYCSYKDNVYNIFDIKKYCKKEEYFFLCYIGKQIQEFALTGNILDITDSENNINNFKCSLLDFMQNYTEKSTLSVCKDILFYERNTEIKG